VIFEQLASAKQLTLLLLVY